jgi:SNF2 family DNA or RNA helicase
MIADESQRIKNHRAKQSRFTHILGANVRYRLLLTGTPVTQSPLDFWSQYRYLDPTILPRSYYAFRNTYAVMGGYEGKQVVGYQNLDRLTSRVHSIAYRITKEQALDLPETINQERYVRLPPRVMREYKRMVAEDIALIEGGSVTSNNLLTRLLRLSQITGGHITTDNGEAHQVHDEKLKELMDIIDDTAGKVVVFARFTAEIKAIRSALEEKGIGYGLIDGSVGHSKRGAEVRRFQEDEGCRVFIAQLQAAGLGITLTAASTAVFYSLNYSFADYDQCRARIHRIGQHYPCTYIHLIAEDTVDEKVLEILNKKGSLARLVVDEWRTLLKGERNL